MTRRGRRQAALAMLLPVLLLAAPRLLQRHRGGANSRVWHHSPVTGHWYTLLNDNLDQPAAQALAESWGAYLACLNTRDEADWVVDRLLGKGCTGALVGLRRGPDGTWRWADGSGLEQVGWLPDVAAPDESDAAKVCADLAARGALRPVIAEEAYRWALVECERDPNAPVSPHSAGAALCWLLAAGLLVALTVELVGPIRVPARRLCLAGGGLALLAATALLSPRRAPLNEWLERRETGHWYRLAGPGLWYDEAAQLAERLGGRLAVIETADENDWLTANLLDRPLSGAWIGLREVERKGRWRWADGSAPGYANWIAGGPEYLDDLPVGVAHLVGRSSPPEQRLGQWSAVIAVRWETPAEQAYHPVQHALIERDTAPGLSRRPRHLAGLLLAALAPGLLLAARRWWAGLAAMVAGGLVVVLQPGAWPPPAAPSAPAARPADWPAELADSAPPPGRSWADYRVSPIDGMPQARVPGGMTALQGRRIWLREYWIDLQPVTGEQYVRFLNDVEPPEPVRGEWIELAGSGIRLDGERYAVDPEAARLPVTRVTWHGARAYAWWAGRRLPSEAQWEHATGEARAEAGGPTPSPSELLHPLGQVREWCEDWYYDKPISRGNATDPLGSWPDPRRVHRGASTGRGIDLATTARADVGFRCVTIGAPAAAPRRTGLWAPPGWPAWLAERDYAPPPGMSWADFRVAADDAMPQVRIAAGEFFMGTTPEQLEDILDLQTEPGSKLSVEDWSDEMPRHLVELSDYWIDLHEVTVGQYRRFLAANPAYPPGLATLDRPDDAPVAYVSWLDACAYAAWVGRNLPTEAQWEKAARGGLEDRLFAWGDALDPAREIQGRPAGAPIAGSPVNSFGLYDLIGGVAEWCRDDYRATAYESGPRQDPVVSGSAEHKVARGGAYNSPMVCLRPGIREALEPDAAWHNHGFRCVSDGTAAPRVEPPARADGPETTVGANAPARLREQYRAEYRRLGGEAVLGRPLGPVLYGADGLISGYSGEPISVQEFEHGALTELDGQVAGIYGVLYRAWIDPYRIRQKRWNQAYESKRPFAGGWRGWFGAVTGGQQAGLRSPGGTAGEAVRCEGAWICLIGGRLELVPDTIPPDSTNASIAALWEARGKWSSDIGWPLEPWDVVTRIPTGARAWQQRYETGTIYGYVVEYVLHGPWHDAWWRNDGYERLGFPLNDVESTPEGEWLEAQNGALYRRGEQVYAVAGALFELYNERGGPAGLGLPLGDEQDGWQQFERGTLP